MTEEKTNIAPRKSNLLKDVVSGNVLFNVVLVKHRWYILYLFALAVFYISMHYYMEGTVRQSRLLRQDLISLRIENTIRTSELMLLSRRSEVTRQIKQRGMSLQEPQYPPKRIKK